MTDKIKKEEDKTRVKEEERQAPGRETTPEREDFPEEPRDTYPPVLGRDQPRPVDEQSSTPDVSEQVNQSPAP